MVDHHKTKKPFVTHHVTWNSKVRTRIVIPKMSWCGMGLLLMPTLLLPTATTITKGRQRPNAPRARAGARAEARAKGRGRAPRARDKRPSPGARKSATTLRARAKETTVAHPPNHETRHPTFLMSLLTTTPSHSAVWILKLACTKAFA